MERWEAQRQRSNHTHTHTHSSSLLIQWHTAFQQSLPLPAWQTLAEGMCSCRTAPLTACSPFNSSMVGKRHFLWGRLDESIREGEGPGLVVVPVVLPRSLHKGHKDLQPPSASSQPLLIRHNDLTGSSESQWQRGTVVSPCGGSIIGLETHYQGMKICHIS